LFISAGMSFVLGLTIQQADASGRRGSWESGRKVQGKWSDSLGLNISCL